MGKKFTFRQGADARGIFLIIDLPGKDLLGL
jgi:hypothetical protein